MLCPSGCSSTRPYGRPLNDVAATTAARRLRHPLSAGQRQAAARQAAQAVRYVRAMSAYYLRVSSSGFRSQLRCRPLGVDALLRQACRDQADSAGSIDYRAAAAQLAPVWGDGRYVRVALRCLIDNALQYSAPTSHVSLWAEQYAEHTICIGIADVGRGIGAADQAHMFKPFWPARPGPGTSLGLGLPIAKAIVEALGGNLGLRTFVGVGTTFYVWLPTAARAQAAC